MVLEVLGWFALALVVGNALPAFTYQLLTSDPLARAPILRAPVLVARGSYRSAVVRPPPIVGPPPTVVRVAAYGAFLLGQLLLPKALVLAVAAVGVGCVALADGATTPLALAALGGAASTLASIAVDWRLFVAGGALLCRDSDAVQRARAAARLVAAFNIAVLLAVSLAVLATADQPAEPLWAAVLPPVAAYALLSLAQAGLMFRAARALEQA